MKIVFTVPDQTLAYDCRSCGSFCCQGKGFGLDLLAQEEKIVLEKAPLLKYFLLPHADGNYAEMESFEESCYFLDDDGLCAIQKDGGFEAKPFVCKFFPLNFFTLAGDRLIVDLHFMCPVSVSGSGTVIEHAKIAAKIGKVDPKIFRQFEIKDAEIARQVVENIESEAQDTKEIPSIRRDTFYRGLCEFLDHKEGLVDDPQIRGIFKVISLSLRVKLLVSRSGPLKITEYQQTADGFLKSLYLYAHILKGATDKPLQIKTVFDLFNKKWALFYFLSHLDDVPLFEINDKFDEKKLPAASESPLDKLFSTYVYQQTKGGFTKRTLRELAENKVMPKTLPEKLTFLQRLGNIVTNLKFERR